MNHSEVVEAERVTLYRIRALAHTLAEVTEAYTSMSREAQDGRHIAGSEILRTLHTICDRLSEAVRSLPDGGP